MKEKKNWLTVLGWFFGVIVIIGGVGLVIGKDFLSGILFLIAGLIVLPPFMKWVNEKYKIGLPVWSRIIIFIILVILATSVSNEESNTIEDTPFGQETSDQSTTEGEKIGSSSNVSISLEDSLNNILGKSNFENVSNRIVSLEENTTEDGKREINIGYFGNDNVLGSYVFRGMVMDTMNLAEYVSKSTDYDTVRIYAVFPRTDQYGNSKWSIIFMVSLNRETMDKINWENLSPENFFIAVDLYSIYDMNSEFSDLTGLYCYDYCLPSRE